MLDAGLRRRIDPALDVAGRWLSARGVGADQITVAGFLFGVAAALAATVGQFTLALGLVAMYRLADGLDGAVARATRKTDRGGFLDIVLDFVFYALMPLAFAAHDPAANALAAATLIASFLANGVAFLAVALLAGRAGLEAQGVKSFYYVAGLAEGAETIAAFILMCLLPQHFAAIAYGFAALCAVSAAGRVLYAWRVLA